MKLKTPTLFLWVVLIAGAAIAGEQRQNRMQIIVEDDTRAAQSFLIDADNESHGDRGARIIKRKTTVTN